MMKRRNWQAQGGVTLVELMVSIVIALVIVLFLSTLFVNSRQSARLSDDSSRMQEEGRSVMSLIARNLMQAGYGNVNFTDLSTGTTRTLLTDFAGSAIRGCDNGFADLTLTNLNCAAGGRPAFQVSYNVGAYNANTGAGADCNGQDAGGTATNRFYLGADRTLFCLGNGNATPQPLLSNVDNMQITYGVNTNEDIFDEYGFVTVNQFFNAAAVNSLTPGGKPAPVEKRWDHVVSVNVCMELSSPNDKVTPQKQSYTPCGATAPVVATDNRLHTVISGVYTLRNNGSVRNFQ